MGRKKKNSWDDDDNEQKVDYSRIKLCPACGSVAYFYDTVPKVGYLKMEIVCQGCGLSVESKSYDIKEERKKDYEWGSKRSEELITKWNRKKK